MAHTWNTEDPQPRLSILDLRLDDEAYKLAAQAKVRAGYNLTDAELVRLLQCELPPERELELNRLAEGMEADWEAYKSWKRRATIWSFAAVGTLLAIVGYAASF